MKLATNIRHVCDNCCEGVQGHAVEGQGQAVKVIDML